MIPRSASRVRSPPQLPVNVGRVQRGPPNEGRGVPAAGGQSQGTSAAGPGSAVGSVVRESKLSSGDDAARSMKAKLLRGFRSGRYAGMASRPDRSTGTSFAAGMIGATGISGSGVSRQGVIRTGQANGDREHAGKEWSHV